MQTLCNSCCDGWPPLPPRCACPDMCKYQIEVVEPFPHGPLPNNSCDLPTLYWNNWSTTGNPLIPHCAAGDGPYESFFSEIRTEAPRGATFRTSSASITSPYIASAQASFGVLCGSDPFTHYAKFGTFADPSTEQWWIKVDLQVRASKQDPLGLLEDEKKVVRTIVVPLSQTCRFDNHYCSDTLDSPPFADCGGRAGRFRRFETPLTITVDAEGTSVGAWQNTEITTIGDQSVVAQCIAPIEQVFAVTFRITERETCCEKVCGCENSPIGLRATFAGKQFVVGEEYTYTEEFDQHFLLTLHYTEFGGDLVFEERKVLKSPANAVADQRFVYLYCEADDDPGPPAQQWYALFQSTCRVIDPNTTVVTQETTRTEIGYFVCRASQGCGPNDEGDLVPLDEPRDIEEIPESPTTPLGADACVPPQRPSFALSEICE